MKPTFLFPASLIFVLMLAGISGPSFAADAPVKPNIVFILADDLGWADLGCYGGKFYETPCLDRLSADEMRFTCGYSSSPYCSPSRAAILTGRYPARLQITDAIPSSSTSSGRFLRAEMKMELPLEEVTLAEVMKKQGYATWAVGKWHLGKEPFTPQNQANNFAQDSMHGVRKWAPRCPGPNPKYC